MDILSTVPQLTEIPIWKELAAHYHKIKDIHLHHSS